ncbi:MAG: hypothetical protein MRZ48_08140 [Anaerostipes hadrus]|nr:hypothetical protein [Anaerostipes hadrus]
MLEITFLNGHVIRLEKEQYSGYGYDKTFFRVDKSGVCVGMYNLKFIRSIEVKK